jgi:hypothetical protein
VSPEFPITNFQNGAFESVGSWSAAKGVVLTKSIVWPGFNSELSPSSEVPRVLVTLSGAIQSAAYAVTVRSPLHAVARSC